MAAAALTAKQSRGSMRASARDVGREQLAQRRTAKHGRTVGFMDWALKVPEPKAGTLRFDLFPFQRELYNEGAHDKETVVMKCLDPATRVLTADLRWVPIGGVGVGDELVSVDENAPEGSGKTRKLRRATVEETAVTQAEAYRLTFDNGASVVATAPHRWLARRGQGDPKWRTVEKMEVGDRVRWVCAPWDEGEREDSWFAGFTDGEGSLRARRTAGGTELVLTQQYGPVLDRALAYLRARGVVFRVVESLCPDGRPPVAHVVLTRLADILRVVGRSRPTRFVDGDWWEDRNPPSKGESWPELVEIEPLGEREMVDLQTSTKTFIAEGLVSHNSTQVGVSAWAMRWALFHADTRGYTGLYVFPTLGDMWDFSALRVKPLIDGSDYLRRRQRADDPDNKGMKGIGLGKVVFRGSESKRGLDSVDADHIVFDEYDTLDHANIPDAEERVSSPLSPGLIRRVGVPSRPDWGIAKLYEESDMREWWVKCESCSEWQTLDFFKNVNMVTAQRICAHCQKPIDVGTGEWVARHPDRAVKGYSITRMMTPTKDLADTIKKSKTRNPFQRQVFMNKHLGIAWAPEEGRLSKEALSAAQSAGGEYVCPTRVSDALPETGAMVTMGIDVATVRDLNVRVSIHYTEGDVDKKRALFIGTVENFNDLDKLFVTYGVHMAAIDHLPEGRLAMGFAERHPGQVYLVSYNTSPQPRNAEVLVVNDEMHHATVQRVAAIDATFEMIRQQRNSLPMNLPEEYVEQMQALNRTARVDDVGKKTVVYANSTPDDFAHAEVYDLVATDLYFRRVLLDDQEREEFRQADDALDFERSGLADYGTADYHAGPGDEEYIAGPSVG